MKNIIQGVLNKMGVQLKRYPDTDLRRRIQIIRHYGIDLVFDVGANRGQYARGLRKLGYSNEIVSFEPLSTAFRLLEQTAVHDKKWKVNNYALGNEDGSSVINVSENSFSSSILNMKELHLNAAPAAKYVHQQEIQIKRLDTVFDSFYRPDSRVMMKIDTQGYEKQVIDGAGGSLKNILLLQLEMSMAELYENELLFNEMINYLDQKGFRLVSLENGFYNPETGELLQVDGIFVSRDTRI